MFESTNVLRNRNGVSTFFHFISEEIMYNNKNDLEEENRFTFNDDDSIVVKIEEQEYVNDATLSYGHFQEQDDVNDATLPYSPVEEQDYLNDATLSYDDPLETITPSTGGMQTFYFIRHPLLTVSSRAT